MSDGTVLLMCFAGPTTQADRSSSSATDGGAGCGGYTCLRICETVSYSYHQPLMANAPDFPSPAEWTSKHLRLEPGLNIPLSSIGLTFASHPDHPSLPSKDCLEHARATLKEVGGRELQRACLAGILLTFSCNVV